MDFTIGSKAGKNLKYFIKKINLAGRVVIELFSDITPKTSENFRALCTGNRFNQFKLFGGQNVHIGEYGIGKHTKKKLHYLGCKVHRIVEDFVIQAGDIVSNDGSGGESIYGRQFNDENFTRRHAHAGLVSMANHGRNTNSSQFFITLKPCPHLDGKHVVFGQVIEGMDVVRAIAKVPTDMYEKPRIPVHMFDCGQIGGSIQDKMLRDEFAEPNAVDEYEKARDDKQKSKAKEQQSKQQQQNDIKESESKPEGEDDEDEEEKKEIEELKKQSGNDKFAHKKMELMMKMNEARKLNNKAVVEEQERLQEGYLYEKRRNKEEFFKDKRQLQQELDNQGLAKDKQYAFDTAAQAEKGKKRKGKNLTFGWDVFNEDTLYRAYFKRVKNLPNDKTDLTEEERAALLAQDVEKQIEKRGQFQRTRMFVEDKDIDYINERNRVFNEKLERNFGKHAAEIKANIENGNAI
ncbi:peptidyl-prolyl cis-trans cyclophilin-type family protein [Stylonychia lemnae]|uniref:peptidylprolyl isomerase n=1 Tax=Stylonychia lemnae TaxID=5949 RepID=A0A077ZY09_STYLE|nr:peptidyl-prolyl cis-trans cyclophilin-type family protein [Stylonychia lemnae]|eukprot:CDW74497.1 peptidyl-prolyl cis-trans cyclophilin-type family protein [Stylonychia lemnae]